MLQGIQDLWFNPNWGFMLCKWNKLSVLQKIMHADSINVTGSKHAYKACLAAAGLLQWADLMLILADSVDLVDDTSEEVSSNLWSQEPSSTG